MLGFKRSLPIGPSATLVLFFTWQVHVAQNIVWDVTVEGSNTFSSARAVDLNGDDVLDIVVGSGRELAQTSVGVLAFDGTDGSVLWQTETRSQMFGSPIFRDINNDGIPDVFIGGRRSQFYCIDGSNGMIIWDATPCSLFVDCQSDSLPNFYSAQWIDDFNNDGVPEILNVRGGFAPANANNPNRPAGHLVILDGRTGDILRDYEMPDGNESYCSPVVWRAEGFGDMAVFGSGGETLGGSAWMVSMQELWDGNPQFEPLATAESKGFMAPASITDLTLDGIPDLILLAFDGRVTAVNGLTRQVIWSAEPFPGNESSTSPCLAYFNSDNVPDVALNYVTGVFPQYSGGHHCILDGLTGEVLWSSDQPLYPFHTPVACTIDDQSEDDFFFMTNFFQAGQVGLRLLQVNGYNDETVTMLEEFGSVNLASTPLLVDLDANGLMDVVIVSTTHPNYLFSEDNMRIRRLETSYSVSDEGFTWSGYMGSQGSGVLNNFSGVPVSTNGLDDSESCLVSPNPFVSSIRAHCWTGAKVHFKVYDLLGNMVKSGTADETGTISGLSLAEGVYLLEVQSLDQRRFYRVVGGISQP